MSDEQALSQFNEMLEMFGYLPNPKQEPARFFYFVKLYRYYKLMDISVS